MCPKQNIMRLVVIENGGRLPDNVERFIRELSPEDVRIFTNFEYCDKTDFSAALMWCDTILTETTLIKKYQVDEMVELMGKLPSKQIIFTWKDTVQDLYKYLEDEDDIVKIAHHKIGYLAHTFEIEDGVATEGINNTNIFADKAVIVAEKLRLAEIARLEKLAAEKLYRDEAINRPTGQKVLIKTLQAFGKAWSTLVSGTIVDVLDMTEQDERPNRGVWVWGNGEPVKLLNDSGYDEYELCVSEDTPLSDIALEVLKMVNLFEPKQKDIYGVIGFIEDALADTENKTSQLHWNLTTWLDENEYPRRGNRNKIELYLGKALSHRLK